MSRKEVLSVLAVLMFGTTGHAYAQQAERFDAGVSVIVSTLRELDSHEVGVSGRLGWRPTSVLGFEGELGFYPADLPSRRPVTSSRTELAFGVTAGPRLGRLRPFVRLRPGVLHMAEAPGPVACILSFPPPLSCTLASGRSLFMLDLGGGVELNASRRSFVRVDVGDRLVRYPGPAIGRDRAFHDEDFSGHDLRVAIGAGWRF